MVTYFYAVMKSVCPTNKIVTFCKIIAVDEWSLRRRDGAIVGMVHLCSELRVAERNLFQSYVVCAAAGQLSSNGIIALWTI